MNAGELDRSVELERASMSEDAYGQQVETWSSIGREPVKFIVGSGTERRTAAQESGRQSATFRMRSHGRTRSLSNVDRLSLGGTIYDIEDIAFDRPRKGWIEITGVTAR